MMRGNNPVNKKRILIVDDDNGLCAQLGQIIEFFGYEPLLAHSLSEARAHVAATPADAVIADLHLPDGTGVELLHELHEKHRNLPVIILTGFPSEASIRQTLLEGGYTYLAKPVPLEQLRALLDHALKTH
jgi:two-component system, NtrC family, response regulator PilR